MAWDPVWETIFSSRPWGKYPGEELIRFVAMNFYKAPDRAAVRLLEIGCGTGANIWFIAREGFGFAGVDGSPAAIAIGAERLDAEVPGWRDRGQMLSGDILSLPFADASFDAVIDNDAVCCNSYTDSKAIYREAARVCKSGGKLYVRTFATGSWGEGSGEQVGPKAWKCTVGPLANTGYVRFTSEDEIPDLLSGFRLNPPDMIQRSVGGLQNVMKEWVITGVKA